MAILAFNWFAVAAVAQTLNPLEQAEPCREAGKSAIRAAIVATSGESYQVAISALETAVDRLVAAHGESDESSLHCLNAQGSVLLNLGEHALEAGVYRRAAAIALKTYGSDDDGTLIS